MAANIRIYDTLTKQKKPLEPVTPGKVGIYLCGPTVYAEAHIGHMVGPVIFDAIKRYLVYSGYNVTWVVNITDVDDKLIHKANELGISMPEVADRNIQDYLHNLAGVGVDQIDSMPKATEHMDEIIQFTVSLIDKGFAYAADGDVFFDCGQDSDYGKLTNRTLNSIQGEGGGAASKKRSAADFALWKAAKPGEPSWSSPWGEGRPGWHIECSAMSRAILGETFDIHGGGLDLIFPHHENEIAQSECCHSKPMANFWMHNGLLRKSAATGKIGGRGDRDATDGDDDPDTEKMSRSEGAGGLADQIKEFGGETIRFFLLRTHYRSTVMFGNAEMDEARHGLDSFYRYFKRYQRVTGDDFYSITASAFRADGDVAPGEQPLLKQATEARAEFIAAMDDDFNTGVAVSVLFDLTRELNKYIDANKLEESESEKDEAMAALRQATAILKELAATLGLFLKPVEADAVADDALAAGLMELIIDLRAEARKNKDWGTADRIRDGLKKVHVVLEDRAGGTEWEVER